MSKKNILKRELLNYIREFPEEARNALAPRVEATLRNALAKARTGMIINRGSNNLRIKGLPKITGSHILEILMLPNLRRVVSSFPLSKTKSKS